MGSIPELLIAHAFLRRLKRFAYVIDTDPLDETVRETCMISENLKGAI
jgi:hypothetical protein